MIHFIPSSHFLLVGGWTAIVIALVACAAIAYVGRRWANPWLVFVLGAALVVEAGFTYSVSSVFTLMFWIAWAMALICMIFDSVHRGEDITVWHGAKFFAGFALVIALLSASNFSSAIASKQDADAMKRDITAQITANNAEVTKFLDTVKGNDVTEVCKAVAGKSYSDLNDAQKALKMSCDNSTDIAALDKRVGELEKNVKALQTDVDGMKKVLFPNGVSVDSFATSLASVMQSRGFSAGQYTVDSTAKNPNAAGVNVFGQPINGDRNGLSQLLNGSEPSQLAAQEIVFKGMTPEQMAWAKDATHWVSIQTNVPVCYSDMYNWDGKSAQMNTTPFCSGSGEVFWVLVNPDGTVAGNGGTGTRDGCANPAPVPVNPNPTTPAKPKPTTPGQPTQPSKPGTPTTPPSTPPPTTTPPSTPPTCPPGTTGTPPNCLEQKDPSKDPAQNGNAGNGGGKNQDPGPGATTTPTHAPTTARSNPAAPTASASTVPTVTSQPLPPEQPKPTVVPSSQPTNTGKVTGP